MTGNERQSVHALLKVEHRVAKTAEKMNVLILHGYANIANDGYVHDHIFTLLPFVVNAFKQSVYEAPYHKEVL